MVVADKNTFIRWAVEQPQLPVFFQPWYLDAVCSNGQWQAHLYQNDKGTIEGVLVYYLTTKYKTPSHHHAHADTLLRYMDDTCYCREGSVQN